MYCCSFNGSPDQCSTIRQNDLTRLQKTHRSILHQLNGPHDYITTSRQTIFVLDDERERCLPYVSLAVVDEDE